MAHNESYSLNHEKDRDLIDWLARQPSKSATTRTALYFYKTYGETTDIPGLAKRLDKLPELLEVVIRIEKMLNQGVVVSSNDRDTRPIGLDVLLNAAIDEMENIDK